MMKIWNRNRNEENRKKPRLPLSAYLTYLLIATFVFTGVSFSKFAASASGSDSVSVAGFNVRDISAAAVDSTLTIDLNSDSNSQTAAFQVSCDADVACTDTVTVTLPGALPSGVTLAAKADGAVVAAAAGSTTTEYIFTKPFALSNTGQMHEWEITFAADAEVVTEEISLAGINITAQVIQND